MALRRTPIDLEIASSCSLPSCDQTLTLHITDLHPIWMLCKYSIPKHPTRSQHVRMHMACGISTLHAAHHFDACAHRFQHIHASLLRSWRHSYLMCAEATQCFTFVCCPEARYSPLDTPCTSLHRSLPCHQTMPAWICTNMHEVGSRWRMRP